METDKHDVVESVEANDNICNVKQPKCVLPLQLLINLFLIIAILFVSALWANNRKHNNMDMIPSPYGNRSISVPTEAPGEKPKKLQPEEYMSLQIEKVSFIFKYTLFMYEEGYVR